MRVEYSELADALAGRIKPDKLNELTRQVYDGILDEGPVKLGKPSKADKAHEVYWSTHHTRVG